MIISSLLQTKLQAKKHMHAAYNCGRYSSRKIEFTPEYFSREGDQKNNNNI